MLTDNELPYMISAGYLKMGPNARKAESKAPPFFFYPLPGAQEGNGLRTQPIVRHITYCLVKIIAL